jgi:endonuclease III
LGVAFRSILDYRTRAERAWEGARRFAEETLGDPDDLWGVIVAIPEEDWLARKRQYGLHFLVQGHARVWRIAQGMVQAWGGDARRIWSRQSPATVLDRLNALRVGPQIACMIVGALMDTGLLSGSGDVKADLHVRRVLGRVLTGEMLSETEATELTRTINPGNPWAVDGPLYSLGKDLCRARAPYCEKCDLSRECRFAEDQ